MPVIIKNNCWLEFRRQPHLRQRWPVNYRETVFPCPGRKALETLRHRGQMTVNAVAMSFLTLKDKFFGRKTEYNPLEGYKYLLP